MNADDYIAQRLDDQLAWYDRKSTASKRWYLTLRIAEFLAAALIPFLAAFLAADGSSIKLAIGGLGVAIAVITATLGLLRLHEHWIEYRTTSESLKKEKFLFLSGSSPYDGEPGRRFQLLVQRVEALISKENTNWAQFMARPEDEEKRG